MHGYVEIVVRERAGAIIKILHLWDLDATILVIGIAVDRRQYLFGIV